MSLTIFPQAFSVGFSPQYQAAKAQSLEANGPPQVESNGQVSGNQTDLNTVKIISDDNDVSSENTGLAGSENKTRVRIDPESQEIIVEVVDDKTGKEVRQIPGEQKLALSKGISEYNNVAFKHEQTA
ncbi:MAG: hypothetical protein HN472_14030 [Nitrospina sp.]|jgi:uncharacterized FlaG/YvyC family protein|nr:hypothetical protein [Nitrospina sp.]MBT3874421.1 hypothetical protein [Nitrospina sp.]MBT4047649.1 hypothetical protein [Nitrospina sp.]MBT4556989.1 hypothetical protein [Nitrospina sp.]MBT5347500.1 hypothetical protein [Nitrospina sp.]